MISDKRKQKIKAKAQKAAEKANAPQAKQLANDRARATKSYTNQVGAAKAASQQVQAALLAAIAGARESGLKGRYLKSTVAELKAQKGDAEAMVPFTRSQIRPDYIDTLQSLNQQSRDLQRSTAASARDALQTKLADIREAKAQKAEDRRNRVQTNKNATIILHNLLDDSRDIAGADIPKPPDDASDADIKKYNDAVAARDAEQQFLNDLYAGKRRAVRHFSAALASKAEGLDQHEAMQFVMRMMARRRQEAMGDYPDLPDWLPGGQLGG